MHAKCHIVCCKKLHMYYNKIIHIIVKSNAQSPCDSSLSTDLKCRIRRIRVAYEKRMHVTFHCNSHRASASACQFTRIESKHTCVDTIPHRVTRPAIASTVSDAIVPVVKCVSRIHLLYRCWQLSTLTASSSDACWMTQTVTVYGRLIRRRVSGYFRLLPPSTL